MNITYYVAFFLLGAVLIRELLYLKDLNISTKKNIGEVLIIIIGIITVVTISVIFAKNTVHYVMGCVGLGLLIADWSKQGISKNGILLVARGKELYVWNEIQEASINISNKIKIDYFITSNSKIVSQYYSVDAYDKILKEFKNQGVTFKIIHNTN